MAASHPITADDDAHAPSTHDDVDKELPFTTACTTDDEPPMSNEPRAPDDEPPMPTLPPASSQIARPPAAALRPRATTQAVPARGELDLEEWLAARGVKPANAERFIAAWGCESTADVALLLRFELAPLHLANDDNVNADMRRLFGCGADVAKSLVAELDVFNAINLDTRAEVRREVARTQSFEGPTRGRLSGTLGTGANASQRHSVGRRTASQTGMMATAVAEAVEPPDAEGNDEGAPARDDAVSSDPRLLDNSQILATAKQHAFSRILSTPVRHESATVEMDSISLPPMPVVLPTKAPSTRRSLLRADSFALAEHPTGSHALAPGPYHRANARLRQLLPHYTATVTVAPSWAHVALMVAAVLCALAYFAIRLWYLTSGRTAAFAAQNTSIWYSWVVLVAEVGLLFLALYGRQNYFKQQTVFSALDERATSALVKEVGARGVTQTVHVMVTTYGESAEMVRECLLRLLVAPEPLDMEKYLYVCDDGHAKPEGPKKRAVVEELRALGHLNVRYIGDRERQAHQLNGKSANLNHVITQTLYKGVTAVEQVPEKDILMVMDCDHMAKPDLFNKMGPCMRDRAVGVTLVPQWFHNLVLPDCLDIANADFFFGKLPFAFGAGQCCITGTNVMIRARAAFSVSKYASDGFVGETGYAQVYSEDEISEDTELGSRVHAAGYKSVLVSERLCTGEAPLEPRFFWRQRLRWLKGSHLYVTGEGSLFFEPQPHMSFWQKSLYWLCPVCHFVQVWAEPVLFTLPFLCLVLDVCPYGMDEILFASHFVYFGVLSAHSVYYSDPWLVGNALRSKTGGRLLWFTAFKACVNTLMVHAGVKAKGHFKFTPKAGLDGGDAVDDTIALSATGSSKGGNDGKAPKRMRGYMLQRAHQRASRVTEARKACMPWDGTLDVWVLLFFLGLSLFAAAWGLKRLVERGAIANWNENGDSLLWVGVVFALVDSVPGLLFLGYVAVYERRPGFMKVWSAVVWYTVATLVVLVELRMAIGFASGR